MKQKGELTLINNEWNEQKAGKQGLASQIDSMISELNKLLKQTDAHKQNISSQKSELSERETTIRDKDARIAALKLKTQELEKFKFVLDYKIKELKKDIKPNAEAIGVLKEQTTKMNQEVKHFSRVKTNLELIVTDLKLKMDGLILENKNLRKKIEQQNTLKRQFKDDIYDMLQNINDYKNLKKSIVRMYKKYVATKDLSIAAKSGGDSDQHKESTKQREYLEESLNNVTAKLTKSYTTFQQSNKKIMTENVILLQEINSLKKEHHELQLKLRAGKTGDSKTRSTLQVDPNESEEIQLLRM